MRALRLPAGILRYHDLDGPERPLVFLHGLGCASSCDYPSVARHPALARRRAILIDLLGAGFSDRPEAFSYSIADHAEIVASLIVSLELVDCDLYGHSMGGSVAIEVATRCERVGRLVVSEPNLDAGGGAFSRGIAASAEVTYVREGHAHDVASALAAGNSIWAGSMAVSSPLAVHRSATALVAGGAPSWRDQLVRWPGPRTVIFGAHSLPDADHAALPGLGISVAVVADAGHSMAWENPSGLAQAIAVALRER